MVVVTTELDSDQGAVYFTICEITDSSCFVAEDEELLEEGEDDTSNTPPNAHVVIGVSGLLDVHDPRFFVTDQPGLLWNRVFGRQCRVLGCDAAEPLYLDWSPEEQYAFSTMCSMSEFKKTLVHSVKHKAVETITEATIHVAAVAGTLGLIHAVRIPSYINMGSEMIDNAFACAWHQALDAGHNLAHCLQHNVYGNRPITLVAFSVGCVLVERCLLDLYEGTSKLKIENVFLLGSPIDSDPQHWKKLRSVVAGRLVNVYSSNDWFLTFLCRTKNLGTLSMSPAGVTPVKFVLGIENVDVSSEVQSHSDYLEKLDVLLAQIPPHPTPETLRTDRASHASFTLELDDKDDSLSQRHIRSLHSQWEWAHSKKLKGSKSPNNTSICFTLGICNQTNDFELDLLSTVSTSSCRLGYWDVPPPDVIPARSLTAACLQSSSYTDDADEKANHDVDAVCVYRIRRSNMIEGGNESECNEAEERCLIVFICVSLTRTTPENSAVLVHVFEQEHDPSDDNNFIDRWQYSLAGCSRLFRSLTEGSPIKYEDVLTHTTRPTNNAMKREIPFEEGTLSFVLDFVEPGAITLSFFK